ncbi:MAG: site-specific integrase, partial [Oscillospiraceae bacterium]|nr:site-specific integrase [Oscillospiraceae bacterium]
EGWSKKTVERELNRFAAQLENELQEGEVLTRKQELEQKQQEELERAKLKTLRQYGDNVYMAIKLPSFSENTVHSYRNALDMHIYPALGDQLISEVTPSMITAFLADRQKHGLKSSSINKLWIVLSGIFKMAYNDETIDRNPMDKAMKPRERKSDATGRQAEKAYSLEELRHILECLQNEPLKWRTYVTVLIDTGMRRGEACGLMWNDIDFRQSTVTVRHNLQFSHEKGIYMTTPKNGETRTVDIGESTLKLLTALRREQADRCISKFVFSQDGTPEPMHPTSPTHYFGVFSRKYGIEDFHPHKLRHTMASLAITNGADVASVSARLGHRDSAVTLRMYTHASEESVRRAGSLFRAAVGVE